MKLHARLWVTFSLLIVVVSLILYIFIIKVYEARMLEGQKQLIVSQGYSVVDKISGTLPRFPERTEGYLSFYSKQLDMRLFVLHPDRTVWFDSFRELPEHSKLTLEILKSDASPPVGLYVPTSSYGYVQYTMLELDPGRADSGYLLMVNNVDFLYEDIRSFRIQVITILLATVILFFFICYLIASWFTKPIRSLSEQMKKITPLKRVFRPPSGRKDEIGELAVEIGEMVSELNRYDQRQKQFMSSSSHELKTPLATMQLICENLPYVREEKDAHQEFLNDLEVQIGKMKHIVESMLDVNRMWDRPLNRIRLQSQSIEAHIREHFQFVLDQKSIRLKFIAEDGAWLEVDEELFHRGLDNVVSNAIRYSPANSEITVAVKRLDLFRMECTVCDQGIGISAEDLPQIFEPFYRSPEAGEWDQEGSGLGLTIVKQMVDMHGAEIRVTSTPGEGTCITMVFRNKTVTEPPFP
ncbi:cell wall metabolism sensor histidine kinase WalK [Paenibacillus sp. J2TS4]|uniref:sensor histidine kinase n=1 Tax=Paenibacillus sp. J2TS4 TaxID=2807194 RepID=UPI001B041DAB|nr:HAMP domain-containing sensor histidine kinase [Paenibacillus sp. J2TS4]GIP34346.1 hypothetical protein J2TS4_35560 [Paenibacillus sp. J2TS4]